MMRTIAPKLFGGRLCRNCARTMPELPAVPPLALNVLEDQAEAVVVYCAVGIELTVCPCHLAPDDSYLGAADLPLAAVDVCDALAEIEGGVFRALHAFDLDEGCVGVGVAPERC